MTLEEAIKHAEEVAEENQRVVDTHIVFDDVTIDMLYCDDTEVIEEHLANYQMCAENHRQLAEWLKDYKRLLEQEPILDKIRVEITDCLKALDEIDKSGFNIYLPNEMSGRRLTYQQCLEFIDKYKEEKENG